MKKIQLFLLLMMAGTFSTVYSQVVDTVGVYNLSDGGGDPTIKSARVKMQNVAFSDYARVGVLWGAGSGFFVSQGFPVTGADYDPGKYHTFTVTPQNGATLFIKKFTMQHKRSAASAPSDQASSYKCTISYDNTQDFIFGSGTSLNPTAMFYADNMNITTTGAVTFKFYVKDMFSAAQCWNQRYVSIIGSMTPATNTAVSNVMTPVTFNAYPVITKDNVNISYAGIRENTRLEIYNSVGAKVASVPVAGNSTSQEISLAKYPKGIYYLSLDTKSGVKSCKIIRN